MRISFANQKEATLLWINRRREDIADLTNVISSQKKLSSPSDAPASWARAMDFKHGLEEYDAILGNIDFATGWNESTDSALNGATDLISKAHDAAISALSPSGMDQRDALITQLDGVIKNLITVANTQYGDQYVFAGTNYSSPPFSIDDATGVVTYSGNDEKVQVRTNRGANGAYKINLTGTEAFSFTSGGSTLNAINEVWQLKEAIRTGNSTAISAKLGTLDEASAAISKQSSTVGSRLSTLEQRKSALEILKTNTQSSLSDVEDADLPEAITKLQQESTAFEAALKVTALVENLNLAYYLA